MSAAQITNELLLAQLVVFGALGLGQFIMLIVLVWQLTRCLPGMCITHTFTLTDLNDSEGDDANRRPYA